MSTPICPDSATVTVKEIFDSSLDTAIKAPSITSILTAQHPDNISLQDPVSELRERLAQNIKRGQRHVAEALAHSSNYSQVSSAFALTSCGRFATVTGDFIRLLNRCHRRSCPACTLIKGRQFTARTLRAINQMRYSLTDEASESCPSHLRMKAIKLTLNGGRACHFDNIKSRLSSLHATWSSMLRTEGLKAHIIGAMRSTEITESPDDPNHANPHIHALLLVRVDTPLSEIERLVKRYWPKVIKRNVSKSEKVINHDVSCSVREIKYTESHTSYDVRGWIEYITKGSYDLTKESHTESHRKTSRLYWLAVDQAIKGMRLISLSGDLKEASAKVKKNDAREKEERGELPLTDPTPTHLWSDYRGRFVSLAEADTHDANMTPLVRSSSYISPPPLFGMIARHEIYAQLEHTQKQHYDVIRSRLLSSENRDLLPIIDALIRYNIKKVKGDHRSDNVSFYEAHEIERSSLAEKRSLMIKNNMGSAEGEE